MVTAEVMVVVGMVTVAKSSGEMTVVMLNGNGDAKVGWCHYGSENGSNDGITIY